MIHFPTRIFTREASGGGRRAERWRDLALLPRATMGVLRRPVPRCALGVKTIRVSPSGPYLSLPTWGHTFNLSVRRIESRRQTAVTGIGEGCHIVSYRVREEGPFSVGLRRPRENGSFGADRRRLAQGTIDSMVWLLLRSVAVVSCVIGNLIHVITIAPLMCMDGKTYTELLSEDSFSLVFSSRGARSLEALSEYCRV